MDNPNTATPSGRAEEAAVSSGSDLARRVLSALVMAPLAIGTAYLGGLIFAVLWGLAAIGVFWEWASLVAGAGKRPILLGGEAALTIASALAAIGRSPEAVGVTLLTAIAIAVMAPTRHPGWTAVGVPYAGAIVIAAIALRSDVENGWIALMFLFAVVWTTDIAAYFVGRLVGGAKLLPRVSPKKTWSGALGGLAAAVLAAIAVAAAAGLPRLFPIAVIAAGLSSLAQAGDLFESLLKRKFGAKDSSRLIPGHGGLMDRLDGFVAAATAAALIGVVRGGIAAPAHGLLIW
ncbi:MAG TPA: phosphatidate cytidylyltransferase [Xanthobacteraceae bacterium]|nr:phosphatidate cytidylyltransferase [Xanthobacteraceae bacterium]